MSRWPVRLDCFDLRIASATIHQHHFHPAHDWAAIDTIKPLLGATIEYEHAQSLWSNLNRLAPTLTTS